MRSVGAEADLGHLKRLLLVEERRQIEALRQDVSALGERFGSDNRFCRAVADSLVVALKVAEVEQHRELAGVMAPIVVAGIRREIAESKDMMVEALYPIVGRLVATAVAQALRQLAEDVNRRIEGVLSPRSLRLRLKALVSRRPLAELVLAEASQNRIDTLLLLDRSSGAVLASSTVRDGRVEAGARSNDSLNLLGGLMAAIIEFANHALSDVDGELRTLDFGGRTVLLRASPLYVVAAIGRSSTSPGLDALVDRAFLSFLEGRSDDEQADLVAMHERFLALHGPKPWNRRISGLTLLAPVLAASVLTAAVAQWLVLRERSEDAGAVARLARAPELAGYPVSLAIDRDRGTLTASALVPNPAAWSTVRRRIADAFPDLRIEERIAVLSETEEARRTAEAVRTGETATAALRADLGALTARLAVLTPMLDAIGAGRKQDATTIRSELASLGERLDRGERETRAALEQRAEVAAAGEVAAAALRADLGALTARLDGLAPVLDAIGIERKQDAATVQDELASLGERLDRLQRATDAALEQRPSRDEVARGSGDTAERLAALSARLETPRRRLLDTIERTAIFFRDDAGYRDPSKAAAALGRLAEVLRAEPGARLRILGFGDSLGTAKATLRVGRLRAEKVGADLAGLGVDPARLKTVATAAPAMPSDDVGAASAGRRVTFEMINPDE